VLSFFWFFSRLRIANRYGFGQIKHWTKRCQRPYALLSKTGRLWEKIKRMTVLFF